MEVKIDYFSVTFPLDCDSNNNVLFKVHEMVALISEYLNIQGFEVNKEMYAQNNFRYQYTLGEAMTLRLDGPLDDSYQKSCHCDLIGESCRKIVKRSRLHIR